MNQQKWISLCVVFFLSGCWASRVERTHPHEQTDLSGYWNDTDSRLTAVEMITDCLSQPWLTDFREKTKRLPHLIVGTFSNETNEHINLNTLLEEFQQTLIESKRVLFVADLSEQSKVRDVASGGSAGKINSKTAKAMPADFLVLGTIQSLIDQDKKQKRKVIYYQVNLKLVDVRSNQIVWNGEKKIKKLIGPPGGFW